MHECADMGIREVVISLLISCRNKADTFDQSTDEKKLNPIGRYILPIGFNYVFEGKLKESNKDLVYLVLGDYKYMKLFL